MILGGSEGNDSPSSAAVIGDRGRATLRLRVRRTPTDLVAIAYTPTTRAAWVSSCTARRGKPVRCGTVKRKLDALVTSLLDAEFSEVRAARAAIAPVVDRPAVRARITAAPVLRQAVAARAASLAPATITRVDRFAAGRSGEFWLSRGDLNGDGRPDALTAQYGGGSHLRVSQPDGTWRTVRLKGHGALAGDLDGDGRDELVTERGDALITDAFSATAVPSLIDLSRSRQPRPRDLVPGQDELDLSALSSIPDAAVTDTSGDGRPELVLGDGPLAVLPSEAFPYGRAAHRAVVLPSALVQPGELDEIFDESSDSAESWQRDAISWAADAGQLFTVSPRDRRNVDATPRPIDLDELDVATGAVRARRTVTAAGWPSLADLDARTGEALVVVEAGRGCAELGDFPIEPPLASAAASCQAQVLRIDRSGRVLATITTRRRPDQGVGAVFAPDGSDPDTAAEVLVSLTGYLNPGELALASSGTTGTVRLSRLPRIDLGGARRDDLVGELRVAVMPNGARWPAIATVPVSDDERRDPGAELLLVQPK